MVPRPTAPGARSQARGAACCCSPRLNSTKSAADGRPLCTGGGPKWRPVPQETHRSFPDPGSQKSTTRSSSCSEKVPSPRFRRRSWPPKVGMVDAADFYPVGKVSEREPRRRCDEIVRVLNWTERFISACDKQPQQESGHPPRAAAAAGGTSSRTAAAVEADQKRDVLGRKAKFSCKPQK
jgi:hypothetical protein